MTTPRQSSSHKYSETPAQNSLGWKPSTPTTRSPGTPTPIDGRPPSPRGSGLASRIDSRAEALFGTHLVRTRPEKPYSNRTSTGIIESVGLAWAIERGRTNVAEQWLSADDIAAHLGVTKDTVYTWIAEKAMPAHKVGRLWKFQASEIDDWVRRGGAAGDDTP